MQAFLLIFLPTFALIYAIGLISTSILVRQFTKKEIARWRRQVKTIGYVFLDKQLILKNEGELRTYCRDRIKVICLIACLGWPAFLRPLLLKKLNGEF